MTTTTPAKVDIKSFDLAREYKFNEKAEIEGLWESLGAEAQILVAAWNNPNYEKAFIDLPKNVVRRMNRGKLTEKEDHDIMVKIIADTILLDWKNLTDEGKVIKYSKAAAIKMLDKYSRFYRTVVEIAHDESRYQEEELEDEIKN